MSPSERVCRTDSLFHYLFNFDKPRFVVPLERIEPAWSVLTYELDEQRVSLPLSADTLAEAASIWTAEMVTRWFAVDNSRVFYYVPQVATYQPNGIPIQPADFDNPATKQ